VCVLEGKSFVAYNFLANRVSDDLSDTDCALLLSAERWTSLAQLAKQVGSPPDFGRKLLRLLRDELLVIEGTARAELDERFESKWEWDIRAGLFHLAIKDPPVMSEEQDLEHLETRIAEKDPVALYTTNEHRQPVHRLERPALRSGLLQTLDKRRTRRSFRKRPLSATALGQCLFAGLGITGFVRDPVRGYGKLPLKLAPSGGARNPYEAYVYAQSVTGVTPGFYHYSAFEHSLGLVAATPLPRPSELLGGQTWYDDAPAIIFLVAKFERTMWKYAHPMAYRAVLIEAGHIGQNIMIAAAAQGLSTSPTALLADSTIEQILGLDHIMESVVYVIGLGHTRKNGLDWGTFEKHPKRR